MMNVNFVYDGRSLMVPLVKIKIEFPSFLALGAYVLGSFRVFVSSNPKTIEISSQEEILAEDSEKWVCLQISLFQAGSRF